MRVQADRVGQGAWLATPHGRRERVVEPPLVTRGRVFIHTTAGQYVFRCGAHVEFFTTEHGSV